MDKVTNIDEITRPVSLDKFIVPDDIKEKIKVRIAATKIRGKEFPNTLITGEAGTGKTTAGMIIAHELGIESKVILGRNIKCADDIADELVGMEDNSIIIFDEAHVIPKKFYEVMYYAMEQRQVPKNIEGVSFNYPINNVTFILITNKDDDLPQAMKDRCGFKLHLSGYNEEHIAKMIEVNSNILIDNHYSNVKVDYASALMFAKVCRNTPRIANAYLDNIIDYAMVNNITDIDPSSVDKVLTFMGIDENGLDKIDRKILLTIYKAKKLPLGSITLMLKISEENYLTEHEPYLMNRGLLVKGTGGRKLSADGWKLVASGKVSE